VQKTKNDVAIISCMSDQALAKGDELGQLRLSLETFQIGRPHAFTINGASFIGTLVVGMSAKGENNNSHIDNSENVDKVMSTYNPCKAITY